MSSAVRRTLNSSGECSSSSRSRSTGSSRLHRERRPALGEALDRDLRGAEPADRVLEADQLRVVAERADLDLDRPSKSLLRGLVGGVAVGRSGPAAGSRRRRGAPASESSCARRPTSTASRSAFIRIRVAWPRACASISWSRAVTASSEAMLRSCRSFASQKLLAEAADLALALDHHPRERGQLGLELGLVGQLAVELADLPLELPDQAVPCLDRRVHFGTAVAEEGPLEATHARHRRGALGRHPGRQRKIEPRGLPPEVLELVSLPRLRGEDVQHGVEDSRARSSPRRPRRRCRRAAARPRSSAAACTSSTIARAWRSLRAVQIARKSV